MHSPLHNEQLRSRLGNLIKLEQISTKCQEPAWREYVLEALLSDWTTVICSKLWTSGCLQAIPWLTTIVWRVLLVFIMSKSVESKCQRHNLFFCNEAGQPTQLGQRVRGRARILRILWMVWCGLSWIFLPVMSFWECEVPTISLTLVTSCKTSTRALTKKLFLKLFEECRSRKRWANRKRKQKLRQSPSYP